MHGTTQRGASATFAFSGTGIQILGETGGCNLSSATGSFGTSLTTSGPCTKDIDCLSRGKACGGDVCSHKGTTPQCVFAVTGDG
ncbi:MAG TPA: hypothetical protein VNW92_20980 [Polyangiaceae bacterium]|nr:hypothetical protein [Polyangiaceae bacterium]